MSQLKIFHVSKGKQNVDFDFFPINHSSADVSMQFESSYDFFFKKICLIKCIFSIFGNAFCESYIIRHGP